MALITSVVCPSDTGDRHAGIDALHDNQLTQLRAQVRPSSRGLCFVLRTAGVLEIWRLTPAQLMA